MQTPMNYFNRSGTMPTPKTITDNLSISLEFHSTQGLEGTVSRLTVNHNNRYKYYTKTSTLKDFINLYTFSELSNLLVKPDENPLEIKKIINFAKTESYIPNSRVYLLETDNQNLLTFINEPNLRRKEFLTKFYEKLLDANQQKSIFNKAEHQFKRKELEVLTLKLMNLLGAKTPTEIYSLKTEKAKIIIKSAVANAETNKNISSERENILLNKDTIENLDLKTIIRLLLISSVLGVKDVCLDTLHNVLLTEKKSCLIPENGKKLKKPVVFDPMIGFSVFDQTENIKNILTQEFKNLIPNNKELQNKILNLDEQEILKYIKKIEYLLNKNSEEIKKVVKEIKNIDPQLSENLNKNIEKLNSFLKNITNKHPNIPKYNPGSNDKNAHKAHQISRLLYPNALAEISTSLGCPQAKIQTSFVASEINSRQKTSKTPAILPPIPTKSNQNQNQNQKSTQDPGNLNKYYVLPQIAKPIQPQIQRNLNKYCVLPSIRQQPQGHKRHNKYSEPLVPWRLNKLA